MMCPYCRAGALAINGVHKIWHHAISEIHDCDAPDHAIREYSVRLIANSDSASVDVCGRVTAQSPEHAVALAKRHWAAKGVSETWDFQAAEATEV